MCGWQLRCGIKFLFLILSSDERSGDLVQVRMEVLCSMSVSGEDQLHEGSGGNSGFFSCGLTMWWGILIVRLLLPFKICKGIGT